MQIERGASNTLVVMARVTLSPSYWLLHFTDIERGGNAYCVVQPGNSGGAFISLTFTETTAPVALDGEVLLAPPGNWNVKIYEQTSSTNLVPASANRLVKDVDVFVVGDGVPDSGWTETCPTDGDECDPLSYSLVNSNNVELDSGSVPDPCGETLTLNAPDAVIRTTDTLLNVAQVPSGDTYDLPQTAVMYAFPGGISQLFLTDTTFDQLTLQTQDFIFMADLRNSLGTALADVTAADLMNDTVPIAPDGTITFDGLAAGTVPSGATENLDCGTLLDAAYVQDGGSVTGTYLITGTLNGSNVYTLDVNHNLEYTGTRWRLVKPGSDIDALVGSEKFPWDADWSATSVTVEQATIGAYCGGNEVPCADLTIAINGTTYGTVADPCGATAPVDVHDSNGNDVGSLVSGAWVVAAPANVLREYTTGGSWSKPTDASFKGVWVFAAGAGGSGGGGGGGASSVTGGSGGGGGAGTRIWIPSASLAPTETIVIGSGGASVASGNGNVGGDSSFGLLATAKGGGAGLGTNSGGPTAGGAGGSGGTSVPGFGAGSDSGNNGGTGSRNNADTAGGSGNAIFAGAGGGGAGGINVGTAFDGSAGGGCYNANVLTAGGAAGAIGGNGTSGVNDVALQLLTGLTANTVGFGTAGGGGGGAVGGSNGGSGGNGGRGAGGGGGGGCATGGTPGASGTGGNGFVLVYEIFAI